MPEIIEKDVPNLETDTVAEFTTIVKKYQRQFIRIAYRMLGSFEDAKDSVQEVFVKFWKAQNAQNSEQDVFSFLTRMLMNLCIDQLRRRKVVRFFSFTESVVGSLPARNPDPGQEFGNDELNAFIESQVAKLKPRQKAIYVLRDIEGYSVKETAKLAGCSESSVLANLHLARKNLRKWLKPYLQD